MFAGHQGISASAPRVSVRAPDQGCVPRLKNPEFLERNSGEGHCAPHSGMASKQSSAGEKNDYQRHLRSNLPLQSTP